MAQKKQKGRITSVERITKETQVKVTLNVDGEGKYQNDTGIPFLDHMLDLFSKHGLFDLTTKAKGDIHIDYHHTVEDVGITLGTAFKKALGDKYGIKRYGSVTVPMNEALCTCAIDISNRPFLVFNATLPSRKTRDFDTELIKEFFDAFVTNAWITLHIVLHQAENTHHAIESIFKAFGQAMDQATLIDPRKKGVPSTKGVL